jgi:hypothetical protein
MSRRGTKPRKFLQDNNLRLLKEVGPPSGQSTTVTYKYEFLEAAEPSDKSVQLDAWNKLRGALKDVFAEFGGGEAYLRAERASFNDRPERPGDGRK